MDPGYRSPLVDLFRRGQAARDMRQLAARGVLPVPAHEQIALLIVLSDDADAELADQANATIAKLPPDALAEYLGRSDVPEQVRTFFASRGVQPGSTPEDAPRSSPSEDEDTADSPDQVRVLAGLPVGERLKLAVKGTREQRAQLIRDSNKIVATAVLSSPKLTESEVEAFCKMGNVSEDVLRIIGMNRGWLKNYGVVLGLVRNPKTPPALSMQMMQRLSEKDIKMLTVDRNVPEALRLAARRKLVKAKNE